MNSANQDDSGAVIVCSHIASGEYPILYAERSEPTDDADTGWQFHCNSGLQEQADRAQVWSLKELLLREPTFVEFVDEPDGTKLTRDDPSSPWRRK